MRWRKKRFHRGDRRVKRRFLFWPKTFDGETRWLEFAGIVEEFTVYPSLPDVPDPHWMEIGFVDVVGIEVRGGT